MNQQIDTYQTSSGVMEPMAPVAPGVLDELKSYAEAWSTAAQIAEQISRTDFAGPFKGKPADLAVAILKGTSIGIPPADIGKAIYVVHGTPALYGKTALAIALQHDYIVETLEDTPEAVTVRMTAPHGQQMDVRYTIERANQEGLVDGNKQQYQKRPSKMLYWKCIGELTDRMIPHLTGGMPIKEDAEQSAVKMQAVRAVRQDGGGRGRAGLQQALAADPTPTTDAPGGGTPPATVADFIARIEAATDHPSLKKIMDEDVAERGFNDDDYAIVAQAANKRWDELTTEAGE